MRKDMKRLIPLFLIAFLWMFSTSSFSYEIQIRGNIPLKEGLSGIAIDPATGLVVAVSAETRGLYTMDHLSGTLLKKATLQITPTGVVVDPGRKIAVVSSKEGVLNFVDIETGSLTKTILTGWPIGAITIDKEKRILFVGNGMGLYRMDLERETITQEIPLSGAVTGMDIDQPLGQFCLIIEGKEEVFIFIAELGSNLYS